MKTFKLVDVSLQLTVSIFFLSLFHGADGFTYWFFTVGTLQLISIAVHMAMIPAQYRSESRRSTEYILLILAIASIVMLFFVLLIAPIVIIWYFVICVWEARQYCQPHRSTFF